MKKSIDDDVKDIEQINNRIDAIVQTRNNLREKIQEKAYIEEYLNRGNPDTRKPEQKEQKYL